MKVSGSPVSKVLTKDLASPGNSPLSQTSKSSHAAGDSEVRKWAVFVDGSSVAGKAFDAACSILPSQNRRCAEWRRLDWEGKREREKGEKGREGEKEGERFVVALTSMCCSGFGASEDPCGAEDSCRILARLFSRFLPFHSCRPLPGTELITSQFYTSTTLW
eukprot:3818386-Rhodomonas_salina.1